MKMPSDKKDISVIICCYNSENKIVRTLEHLSRQTLGSLSCEIILVDNNCSDRTIELAKKAWDSIGNPFELKFIEEKKCGLSFARKRGVFEAKGDFIVFCDDDNWLCENYCSRVAHILRDRKIGITAGNSYEIHEEVPPDWFNAVKQYYAVSSEKKSSTFVDTVWGAGMSFRRKVFMELINSAYIFRNSDRKGNKLTSGGDTEICLAISKLGYKIWHDEELELYHFIPKSRLNIRYAKKLIRAIGSSNMRIQDLLGEEKRASRQYQNTTLYKIYVSLIVIIRAYKGYFKLSESEKIQINLLVQYDIGRLIQQIRSIKVF